MIHATVQHGLERYGAVMDLADVLSELQICERTLRGLTAQGRAPKSIARGKYPTEKVMLAAVGEYREDHHVGKNRPPRDGDDPFA